MLRANEFTVGTLADAKPLSLLLPRAKHESRFLIGRVKDKSAAVFLDGHHRFTAFECANSRTWRGILVPKVSIEIDETSAFDPERVDARTGTLIRVDTRLSILAKADNHFIGPPVDLINNLEQGGDLSAGFAKWKIVAGEGLDRRVLHEVNIE